jgi:NAD(P)-dependent dehydrogenase (short-subunit alcohol dehydrogenase family)
VLTEFGLDGLVVVVTGAGRGIGRAIAVDAARAGAHVVACSRTGSDLESLADEIDCATAVVDVRRPSELEEFLDSVGPIDGLVNNAGSNLLKAAIDYSLDEVDELLDINLRSVYVASVAAGRRMVERGSAPSSTSRVRRA